MRVLVDTNILLRIAQPNHPLCPQATHAVSKLLRQGDALFFCSQNIAEFWNVATRPAESHSSFPRRVQFYLNQPLKHRPLRSADLVAIHK